jgi:biopolymer transport protein TolR
MQFHSSDSEEDNQDLAEINIIPLVDVMLVLLIIFMVAAPLSLTGIQVNLPQTKARGAAFDQKRIVLSIDPKGVYYIEDMRIPSERLAERLESTFASQPTKQLYIRADRKVLYEHVVDAMSAAKLAGVEKISMLTQPLDHPVAR